MTFIKFYLSDKVMSYGTGNMDLRTLILKKKNGKALTPIEIQDFIAGLIQGEFPDYQVSALLMAIVLRGMSFEETLELTREMARHGRSIPRNRGIPRVGKHSTGGVGDKTTFLLGPLVSHFGVEVPFMSGRGLGHTGGTIDKLSGISRIKTSWTSKGVQKKLKNAGFSIFEQTREIAPADRILYSLRDVSGTVESIPLIVSSILSKKYHENLDGLVLDVKFGAGSLMGSLARARLLGKTLLQVAKALKLRATVVFSTMEQPLGFSIGNNLEILEVMECLRGAGSQDLTRLVAVLAQEMLRLVRPAGAVPSLKDLNKLLRGEELIPRFLRGLRGQGAAKKGITRLSVAKNVSWVRARRRGWIGKIHARRIGHAAMALGGGRRRLGDLIDPRVGIRLEKKVGDFVERGDPLARIYFKKGISLSSVRRMVEDAFFMTGKPHRNPPLIAGILRNF